MKIARLPLLNIITDEQLRMLETRFNVKARKMADEIEKIINEKAKEGLKPVTFSVTDSSKAIFSARRKTQRNERRGKERNRL